MKQKPILIVHPYDKSTIFLDRIKNYLQRQFKDEVHYYSVKPNDISHTVCLEKIKNHPADGLIIYLGHGRSDKLYGSKGDDYSPYISDMPLSETPESYYYNDNFINETNINIFADKKVFCLACNSNSKIAKMSLKEGSKVFLGFGDIPTSSIEFEEKGLKVNKNVVVQMKTEISFIIKFSLAYCLKRKSTFEKLHETIGFVTNKRIADILINSKTFKERFLLTDYLYFFKSEIKIYGNKNHNVLV